MSETTEPQSNESTLPEPSVLSYNFATIPISSIEIARTTRQRAIIKVEDLKLSIARNGLLQPIVVTKELLDSGKHRLIAGERRLTACTELGWTTVPVHYFESFDPAQQQVLELEENLKRQDLSWQETCKAIGQLNQLLAQNHGDKWTSTQLANHLSLSLTQTLRYLWLFDNLSDPTINSCTALMTAVNILERRRERRVGDAMSELTQVTQSKFGLEDLGEMADPAILPLPSGASVAALVSPDTPRQVHTPGQTLAPSSHTVFHAPTESIIHGSFLDWAPLYTGRPFNFIHCDFPYGINAFAGPQGAIDSSTTYDDSPLVYERLIECLCLNLNSLMAQSGHLMFWFSMERDVYNKTLDMFNTMAPDLVFLTTPLIWVKSDNKGVLADHKRRPRHTYEAAFIASREDRLLAEAVSDHYVAPTDRALHPSTKPEPMLRHFFRMFVDAHTRLLDPTCGSGASLRAAESLGASQVLGLEIDETHCNEAKKALRAFRALRKT